MDDEWVMVPRMLTPEMADAAWNQGGVTYSQLLRIYKALLDAAPKHGTTHPEGWAAR